MIVMGGCSDDSITGTIFNNPNERMIEKQYPRAKIEEVDKPKKKQFKKKETEEIVVKNYSRYDTHFGSNLSSSKSQTISLFDGIWAFFTAGGTIIGSKREIVPEEKKAPTKGGGEVNKKLVNEEKPGNHIARKGTEGYAKVKIDGVDERGVVEREEYVDEMTEAEMEIRIHEHNQNKNARMLREHKRFENMERYFCMCLFFFFFFSISFFFFLKLTIYNIINTEWIGRLP
jgi:hypothetical protein